jgi:hypothetical protein
MSAAPVFNLRVWDVTAGPTPEDPLRRRGMEWDGFVRIQNSEGLVIYEETKGHRTRDLALRNLLRQVVGGYLRALEALNYPPNPNK